MSQQSNTQKALKGMSSQTVVSIVLGVVEILIFSLMSRLLSKEDFGLFASITAVTTIFSSLSEAGIGSAVIQKKNADRGYVNTAFTLCFILGMTSSLLLVCLSGPVSTLIGNPSLKKPLMCMAITILCNCMTSVNYSVMSRRLEFFRMGMINLISLVITGTLAIVLAYMGLGFYAIMARAVVASLLTLVLSYIFAHVHYRFQLVKGDIKYIVNFGGWILLSDIVKNLAQQADKLLMTRYLSVLSLGAYNRPKEFINQVSSKLNGIFDKALFPILSDIQDQMDSIRNAFHRSIYYLNVFSSVLALAFIFNGELIIRIFFGEQWLNLLPIFSVLSMSLVFNVDGRLCDCFFRSLGLVKYKFYLRLFELVYMVGCLLISFHWGIMGIACATLIVGVTMIFLKVVIVINKIKYPLLSFFTTIFSSWKFAIVVLPPMILARIFFPHTVLFNCINLILFCILILLCFIICPSLAGEIYKQDAYGKVKTAMNDLFQNQLKHRLKK